NGVAGLRWMFPILLLCGLVEGLIMTHGRRGSFNWHEYGASLCIAIGNRLLGLAGRGLLLGVLLWIWQFRLFTISLKAWWGVPLLFLCEEFCYYWEHRMGHRVRWTWATHAVHHSPTELRLSGAYRLGWTGTLSL